MITRRAFLTMTSAAGLAALGMLSSCSSSPTNTINAAGNAANSQAQPAQASNAAANTATGPQAAKAAVVCFSATGNTWAVAQSMADTNGFDLVRIEAAVPYTANDLNYNSDCRANSEQQAGLVRPEVAGGAPDLSGYDTIYLGYPIWWGKTPRIMLTLLESVGLAGKKVAPFCTSGGSDIAGSLDELKAAAPNATWVDGKRFATGASSSEISQWVSASA